MSKRGISLTKRGEPLPTYKFIRLMLDEGFGKEEIRRMCRALDITNFSSTWSVVIRAKGGDAT